MSPRTRVQPACPRPSGAPAARASSRPDISRRTGSVNGTSSRWKRATSSIRSTSRIDVTGAPRRERRTRRRVARCPAASRMSSCSSGGHLEPDERARRARDGTRRPAAGEALPWHRCAPTNRAPASETISSVAQAAACSARYGSTPFSHRFEPSVRSRSRSDVRQSSGRLEVCRLEQDLGRRVRDLRLLPAHDPGERDRPLGVGDHQI